jgi:DoxX-like family
METNTTTQQAKIETQNVPVGRAALWTGRIMSGLVVLFMLMDGVAKLAKPEAVVKGTMELGFPEGVIVPLGVVLIICTLLYAIPRTSILGAILLTGYLGGAIATHVRVGNPLFSHILFPVYIAVLLWGGLFLRDAHLRTFFPVRR